MLSLQIFGFLLLVMGFSEGLFQQCDYSYNLRADSTASLLSPYYPNSYPAGTSCRYRFIAPLDYEILAECKISLQKGDTSCTTERFYISLDGDTSLSGAEEFCGIGRVTRTTQFRTLVTAYISDGPDGIEGSFNCNLTARPQACDCGWAQNTRIEGGVEATLGEFPAMTALYNTATRIAFCGATIISHTAVITAAHCLELNPEVNNLRVLVGDYNISSNEESPYAANYVVNNYYMHPGYNATNNKDDIALVITFANIEWSRGVGPICVPFNQKENTFEYTSVYLVGWGTTSFAGSRPDILQKASVMITGNQACSSEYPSLLTSQVCTSYPDRDACQYDSGGPVIYKGPVRQFLLGVISYGFACATKPGVNTRMTSFMDWVRQYPIGLLCSKPYN